MIEANELRRGNKVSYYKPGIDKPVIDTVIGVLPVEEYGGIDCAYLKNYSPVNIEALIPIPLTPEILEKCGFILNWDKSGMDKGEFEKYYNKEGFNELADYGSQNIVLTNKGNYLECGYYSNQIPCQQLHQLQNLYFALTREELEIKL